MFHCKVAPFRFLPILFSVLPLHIFLHPPTVKRRIVSVGSISKITKAMKMVAASKLRTAQDQLDVARNFEGAVSKAWKEPEEKDIPAKDNATNLVVIMTSDRGLCGGVNSQVVRSVRPRLRKNLNAQTHVAFIGDKARSALEREFSKYFSWSFTEVGRAKRLTFKQCAMVADGIASAKFDKGELTYNRFVSTLSSEPTTVPLLPVNTMLATTDIQTKYENETDDSLYQNFWEFRLAARLFHQSAESYASETAARMNAMSSSSKNAAEMLSAISLTYNRQRQAKITAELIEIISGAAAAEAQQAAS